LRGIASQVAYKHFSSLEESPADAIHTTIESAASAACSLARRRPTYVRRVI